MGDQRMLDPDDADRRPDPADQARGIDDQPATGGPCGPQGLVYGRPPAVSMTASTSVTGPASVA
jgi:hypothetical protein